MPYPVHLCIKHGKECPYFTNPVISSACCASRKRTAQVELHGDPY
jgi:hypothetical protein